MKGYNDPIDLEVYPANPNAIATPIQLTPSDFLIHMYDDVEDGESYPSVYINPKLVWKQRECLADGYSDEEDKVLEPIFAKLNLCQVADSHYCHCANSLSMDELEAVLLAEGFQKDVDFDFFMNDPGKYRAMKDTRKGCL